VDLGMVEIVVIDEADRMADMGFLPAVRRILDATAKERQTILFSATLDGDVAVITRSYQRDAVRHEVPGAEADAMDAEHRFETVQANDRLSRAAEVIVHEGPTIVFCRTRHGADKIAKKLGAAGVQAAPIHGGLSQGQRDRALAAFTRGSVHALVATDVAARGIHVDDVVGVVHLDPPADEKDYIHRSGRTGRAGSEGVVVSFVAPEQRKDVARMQRALGRPVGLTTPDATGLPQIDRAVAPRPRPTPRSSETPTTPDRPRKPSTRSRRRKPAAAGSARSRDTTTSTGARPAKRAPGGNRKARRAHLQPGAADGPTRGSGARPSATKRKRSAGADKGRRRQPSGSRTR
jgi:superfamily II DNA/RNA helicase